MRVLAFTVCHYGKEYLREAILSVKDSVDKHLITYSSVPTFGYTTNLENPDTEKELKEICSEFDHIVWIDVSTMARHFYNGKTGKPTQGYRYQICKKTRL
jgi:hypothetical protein